MNEALHRIALAWLEKARHDLETARRMVQGTDPITDTAVYSTWQQSFTTSSAPDWMRSKNKTQALRQSRRHEAVPWFKSASPIPKSQIQARGQTADESTRGIQH